MSEPNAIQTSCPSCGATMRIVKLECPVCATEVTGFFTPCPVCQLEAGMRSLFDVFLKARGNLKDVQKSLGISYPTVLKRIEEMFASLGKGSELPDARVVLEKLKNKEITVEQAEKMLKGESVDD
ncbi:MAG: DUF2089 domain-containing protein [Spirochaetales bacterium]|nr:DUF2089 domain-containing protein [Spirochaetales bacterium]